ncbi:hypothetical protein [Anabaena sp. PCC 7108]|uniref:hypothetical protein n=1 Tax=Anabaena sp. PCC 7108 TaxID=163908 RepID=UPI0011819F2D|nr:hypothetical protein [Anabaena sp. PCC 7108]
MSQTLDGLINYLSTVGLAMTCSRGKASPDTNTKLRLFSDSGGYCQNPQCLVPLFKEIGDKQIHIAEMAHVFSASNVGPRANKKLSEEERGAYENLILLCPTCHTIIDKAEEEYPDSILQEWKCSHREKIAERFAVTEYPSRSSVRLAILPKLKENRMIFLRYGPETDERFNPESGFPVIWLRKIRSTILPNNRHILHLLDANQKYLNEQELETLEVFRQHADDFEAYHLGISDEHGSQFPAEMNQILGDF